jgi:hypothetical protein
MDVTYESCRYWFVCLSVYGSTVVLLDLGLLFSFLILYTVGRNTWMGDQPVARPLPTYSITQIQNKCIQTSLPQLGFEITIPALERRKSSCLFSAQPLWSALIYHRTEFNISLFKVWMHPVFLFVICRSQRPLGLRHEMSSPSRIIGSCFDSH